MIRTELREVHICDFCKEREGSKYSTCLGCGKLEKTIQGYYEARRD